MGDIMVVVYYVVSQEAAERHRDQPGGSLIAAVTAALSIHEDEVRAGVLLEVRFWGPYTQKMATEHVGLLARRLPDITFVVRLTPPQGGMVTMWR